YTDSGAPKTVDYTTIVILHGSGFNGGTWRHYGFVLLHEHAHLNNLRVVIWNRRNYRGSTKYTDAELEDLKAGRKIFLDRFALQTAWFFEHFIKNEQTPPVSPDRKAGGFILMGWSYGVATTLSLLSDPSVLPKSLYNTIMPYLMSLVLYDPPYLGLGYSPPEEKNFYNPFADPDYRTPEEKYVNFQHWASSYYDHPDITLGHASGISYVKRTTKRTYETWTDAQKKAYFDTEAAARTELPGCVSSLSYMKHGDLTGLIAMLRPCKRP
ncbi:hypothetical protein K438DRAFT_1625545, partial [Mycena galopus ATCC 62051]